VSFSFPRPARSTALRLPTQFPQDRLDLALERRQVMRDSPPHDVQVDSEILMHQHVAHVHNVKPWNLGVMVPQLGGEAPCSLTDHLEMPHHPVLDQFVAAKYLLSFDCVTLDV